MSTITEMYRKTTTSSGHDRMLRSVRPLFDYFGMNHFYYVRTSSSGHCTMLGTHHELMEHLLTNNSLLQSCPLLRKHNPFKGVTIPKLYVDSVYKEFIETAWNRFQVNFTINIQRKSGDCIVDYGFGVSHKHPLTEQHLFNELPLLNSFLDHFHEVNKTHIQLAWENRVNLGSMMGSKFYENPVDYSMFGKKEHLLKQLGLEAALLLSKREQEIINYIVHGYPASFIADQMKLSSRTIENYIGTIKEKLNCSTKVELIQKAQKIASF